MPSAIEKVLGLLVQEGLLTRAQVDEILRSRDGKSSVTDLIVSKGYADAARLSMTLLTLKALTLVCPKCRVRHVIRNIRLDGAYNCKRCGGPLEAEDVIPSGTGPVAKAEDPTPPEVLDARKDPKRVIGKYTLLRELGRGGMAVVYQAWDSSLAQHVALKLIKAQDAGLPDDSKSPLVAEFLREARTAARLQHPNIVRIFEVGSHEGRHFLSMEYVEGKGLVQLIRPEGKGSRIPAFHAHPKRFLVILRDVALALDHAHRNEPPVVHRDVKPQNILVDGKGQARLVDFGLAKEIRGGAGRLTVSGVTKGTPCYMSPEQALGRHGEMDARTDVWGLGATLYEVLCGRPPFEGPTERDILNKVIHEELRRPSDVLRSAGIVAPAQPELETIALKCLEKEPARRYRSAADVARELDRFMAGEGVEARAATPVARGVRWVSRRKPLVAAVGAAVLMGVIALVAILRGGGETRIVERVVVEKDPSAKLSAAALEIERKAADFRFAEAVQAYAELIDGATDPAERGLLRQRLEDLKLQQMVLAGLVDRIRKEPREYAPFRLKTGRLDPARVLDATSDRIILRHAGKLSEHPWGHVDPRQFAKLVRDYWPDLDGRPALGFGVWCLRQGLTDEAAFAFQKQAAPEAKRYLEELSTVRSKELDPSIEEQRLKLLREADEALAKGDLVIARARYERVLTIKPGDADAAKGLERIAGAEKQPAVAAPTPAVPAPQPPAGGYDAAIRRGDEKRSAKDYLGAIEEYSSALVARPNDPQALHFRALARFELKDYASAIADCTAGLDAGPIGTKGTLLELRARARIASGDLAGAVADFDQAIALDARSASLHRERGSVQYHLRRYDKAISDITRAIALQQGSGSDHHSRALCQYDTGNWKEAAADYRRATELGSWNTDYAWIGLWMARARLGEQGSASKELKAYAAGRLGQKEYWFRKIALFLTGDIPEDLFRAYAAEPQDERERQERQCEAYYYAATKRALAGDAAGAEAYFQKCLETGITNFTEYLGAQSELEALAGKRPTGRGSTADWPGTVGTWYYRSLSNDINGVLDVRARKGYFVALGWVRTNAEFLWVQVGLPVGDTCRWLWINQAGEEGESEFRLMSDGTMRGIWWYRALGGRSESFLSRPSAPDATVSARAAEALKSIPGRLERDVFKSDPDLRAWMDKTLAEFGLPAETAPGGFGPAAEYTLSWKAMSAGGSFSAERAPDGRECWLATAPPRSTGSANINYVELAFEAEAGKTYRCWVQVGGCCAETLAFYAQATDFLYADPRQGGKKFAVEPGSELAFPPKVNAGTLHKTHAVHGGRRQPVWWKWVQVDLPAKYETGGTKRVRVIPDHEGFAVRAAVVSSTRLAPPGATE